MTSSTTSPLWCHTVGVRRLSMCVVSWGVTMATSLGGDSGDDLVLEWEQRGLGGRRSVLDAVLDAVKVAPSVNGVGRSVANRTTIRDQRRDPAEDDRILKCR